MATLPRCAIRFAGMLVRIAGRFRQLTSLRTEMRDSRNRSRWIVHEAGKLRDWQRTAGVVALIFVAFQMPQELELPPGLNSLGHDSQAQVVRETDDGTHNSGIFLVLRYFADE